MKVVIEKGQWGEGIRLKWLYCTWKYCDKFNSKNIFRASTCSFSFWNMDFSYYPYCVRPLQLLLQSESLSIHEMIALKMSFSSTWTSVALRPQTVWHAYIIGLTEGSTEVAGFFEAILVSWVTVESSIRQFLLFQLVFLQLQPQSRDQHR